MDSDEDIYWFDPQDHQGLAVVIVNFTIGKRKRNGAEKDLKYMKKTFKRLGFKVECHTDLTKSYMEGLLEEYRKREDLRKYSCFAFGISSFGGEIKEDSKPVSHHAVKMFDGNYFYTKDIIEYFRDGKCRALKNKPKMFFIQACRIPKSMNTKDHHDEDIGFDKGILVPSPGHQEACRIPKSMNTKDHHDEDIGFDNGILEPSPGHQEACRIPKSMNTKDHHDEDIGFDKGILVPSPGHQEACRIPKSMNTKDHHDEDIGFDNGILEPSPGHQETSSPGTKAAETIVSVPCHNDMLIMFASPQGHYAFRSKEHGSHMLKYLYESVEKHYKNCCLKENHINFLDVLRDVTARMAEGTYRNMYKIVPCLVHKLRSDIIFTQGQNMTSQGKMNCCCSAGFF